MNSGLWTTIITWQTRDERLAPLDEVKRSLDSLQGAHPKDRGIRHRLLTNRLQTELDKRTAS